jgi:hypothetical protein
MNTLFVVEKNRIIAGTKKSLIDRVACGDDVVLSIILDSFNENIIMHNMLILRSNCIGFTCPHLGHGSLEPLMRVYTETPSSSIYIYDTESNNVVVHNMVSKNMNSTVVHSNNIYYNKYMWNVGRRYRILKEFDIELVKSLGGDFKVRLDFNEDVKIIIKPDIVYFTKNDTEFVIKSMQILLPTDFVKDAAGAAEGDGFTSADKYGISYITVFSNGKVLIYHIMNCLADDIIDKHVKKNTLNYSTGSEEIFKEYDVDINIFLPE